MRRTASTFALLLCVSASTALAATKTAATLAEPVELTLDRDETAEISLPLGPGEYLLTVDTRRADARLSNLISKISLLDGDGAVIRDGAIAFNVIDHQFRGVNAFELKRKSTVAVRIVNQHDKAEFVAIVHPLPAGFLAKRARGEVKFPDVTADDFPFARENAGLMPFPFFGKTAPTSFALGDELNGELEEGQSGYHAVQLPKGDYKVVLGFEQTRRQRSNLIGYLALLDSAGGAQQKIAEINVSDVSYTQGGGFSLKRDSLVVLRVANRHSNTVKYTVKLRPAAE